MAFCSNCGKELNAGAKFCAECGTPVSTTESKRKTVFEGDIHKCPHCGETLRAFETICPTCGTELRGAKSSSAISALSEKLENATSEKQRIVIIKNFPIPNTKEDIFEFMLLASSNFDSSYYATHLHEEDISDAWLTKIEQCYSKAKLSFGSHPDFEQIEALYLQIKSDCADKERKIKYEEKAQREAQERTETAKGFKKSKLRITIIIFAVISALFVAVSFNDGKILSGIIAILMFASFVTAFLMGSGVIKEKVKNMRLLPLILAFVLFIPYVSAYNNKTVNTIDKHTEFEWPSVGVSQYLPTPPTIYGKIHTDDESRFNIDFYQISQTDFENYVKACKEKGFTISVTKTDSVFYAYNSDEYKLDIFYWEDDEKLTIFLDAPLKMTNIKWPQNNLVNRIPVPESQIGNIRWENSEHFGVYIANMDSNKYSDYVDKCIEMGFNIDYSRGETTFRACDADGYSLVVEKHLFDKIYISIKIPE